jgi:hypothetical protein
MPDHVQAVARESRARAVVPCVESFTTRLSGLGYSAAVVRQKRSMVASVAHWMGRRWLDIADIDDIDDIADIDEIDEIDEAAVYASLAHLGRRRVPIGNRSCTLLTFLEYLRGHGTTIRPEPVPDCSQEASLLQR